jgi:hypothetical protein
MRMTRALFGTVGLFAVLAGLGACAELQQSTSSQSAADAAAHPNAAANRGATNTNSSSVFVQVSPSSAAPGTSVQIRASCIDNSSSATVTSQAFGNVTVQPSNAVLFAEITIPASTRPGQFNVTVTCKNGSTATTTVTIVAIINATPTMAPATKGPNTGGGYLAGHGGVPAGSSTPSDGSTVWFGIALLALLAAAAITVRSRRTSRAAARARQPDPVPVESKERETIR